LIIRPHAVGFLFLGWSLFNAIIDRIPLDGHKAGAVDHFDDLLFGHFYFAFGGVGVG
jgi:hypothetical protein